MNELEKSLEVIHRPLSEMTENELIITAQSFQEDEDSFRQFCDWIVSCIVDVEVYRIRCSRPRYLDLPQQLSGFADDQLYLQALDYGRFWFRYGQYVLDDLEEMKTHRVAALCTRQVIFDYLSETIRPTDPHMAMGITLSWRVGQAMGWLSALSVVQKDDAQAGLAILVGFVVPLLVKSPATSVLNGKGKKKPTTRIKKAGSHKLLPESETNLRDRVTQLKSTFDQMVNLNLSVDTLESMYCNYEGFYKYKSLPLPETFIIDLHTCVGLKYQWLDVAPGLLGQVSSDGGQEVTLSRVLLRSWLDEKLSQQ